MATAAKRRAVAKYNQKNYKSVAVRWPIEFVESLGIIVKETNADSLASFMREALEAKMTAEGYHAEGDKWTK